MILIIGDLYQGKREYALNKYGHDKSYFNDLECLVKTEMSVQGNDDDIKRVVLQKVLEHDVVIANAGYAGLTPIDDKERQFTEIYGRILTELAARAERVERVVCGIGMILK